jgi:TetR/AcrR family transcriptional regulator
MVKNILKANQDAEQRIIDAARKVFIKKGFDGARMQEIADEADINKALLHYYFRSKEKLFDHIFKEAFKHFWPSIESLMQKKKDATVKDLIKAAVDGYMDILERMPFLPVFIIGEINRSPERMEELMLSAGIRPDVVVKIIRNAINNGEMIDMDPRELVVNIVGLSIFPYLSRPLLNRMFWNSAEEYEQFLKRRRTTVFDFICRSVLVEHQK